MSTMPASAIAKEEKERGIGCVTNELNNAVNRLHNSIDIIYKRLDPLLRPAPKPGLNQEQVNEEALSAVSKELYQHVKAFNNCIERLIILDDMLDI